MSRGPKPISESHPHLKEFLRFLDEMNAESARGVALVASSMIDELLRRAILAFLVQGADTAKLVDGFNAPLGTFSARISAAAALGLISEREEQEAHLIRKVRNAFAHNVHTSFEDDAVVAQCARLSMAVKTGPTAGNGRAQFTTAVVALILNLTNRPHYVERKRLRLEPWPY